MDILNWLYLRKQQLIKTTANNADTDLVALGADATFAKRDDQYKTYAMTLKDLSVAGDVANTSYYRINLASLSTVNVTTQKGVIEISMNAADSNPLPILGSSVGLTITNPNVDFTEPDKIFIQYSLYYRPNSDDTFLPYVISTGITVGANFEIFNANPMPAGINQFTGRFYLYYELYNF